MKRCKRYSLMVLVTLILSGTMPLVINAQESVTVLTGAELMRIVPSGFYFQGLSAPTQMRNSAAARFGTRHYVVAGMVDTSGYAADIRARYEGFLITDSVITINGSELGVGAYGFGFSSDGKLNVLDLAGKEILSVATTRDNQLKRPRPLMITKAQNEVRLYSGKDYAIIGAK